MSTEFPSPGNPENPEEQEHKRLLGIEQSLQDIPPEFFSPENLLGIAQAWFEELQKPYNDRMAAIEQELARIDGELRNLEGQAGMEVNQREAALRKERKVFQQEIEKLYREEPEEAMWDCPKLTRRQQEIVYTKSLIMHFEEGFEYPFPHSGTTNLDGMDSSEVEELKDDLQELIDQLTPEAIRHELALKQREFWLEEITSAKKTRDKVSVGKLGEWDTYIDSCREKIEALAPYILTDKSN